MVTCTVSPLSRFTAHLLPVYRGLTNEREGVFLARRSVQHLVYDFISFENPALEWDYCTMHIFVN